LFKDERRKNGEKRNGKGWGGGFSKKEEKETAFGIRANNVGQTFKRQLREKAQKGPKTSGVWPRTTKTESEKESMLTYA